MDHVVRGQGLSAADEERDSQEGQDGGSFHHSWSCERIFGRRGGYHAIIGVEDLIVGRLSWQ